MIKLIKYIAIVLGSLIGGTIIIAIAVTLVNVVGQFIFNYIPFIADIQNKGSLGDAMNGLSAPIITLGSAILIYYTFREQNRANKLLSSQNQFDTFFKLYAEIETGVNNLELIDLEDEEPEAIGYYGAGSVEYFAANVLKFKDKHKDTYLNKLSLVCEDIILLYHHTQDSQLADKAYFIGRLNTFIDLNFGSNHIQMIDTALGSVNILHNGVYDKYLNCFDRFVEVVEKVGLLDGSSVKRNKKERYENYVREGEEFKKWMKRFNRHQARKARLIKRFPFIKMFIKKSEPLRDYFMKNE